jgi:hypothetical protein
VNELAVAIALDPPTEQPIGDRYECTGCPSWWSIDSVARATRHSMVTLHRVRFVGEAL